MEMDFARSRIVALLLLATAAGLFGYSLGWQGGQIDANSDSDRQLLMVREQISHRTSGDEQNSATPTPSTVRMAPHQPAA